MGVGIRVFFIDDDNLLIKIPTAQFVRLTQFNSKEKIPKFANRKIKCAIIVVETSSIRPIYIIHTDFLILHFDSNGSLDKNEEENQTRLVSNMIDLPNIFSNNENIIDVQSHFSILKYHNKYKWNPSPEILSKINNVIFNKKSKKLIRFKKDK